MTNFKKFYDTRFIAAEDLDKELTVTISSFKEEEVFNKKTNSKDKKLTLYFEGAKKGFICNLTNARTIAKVVGSNQIEDWIGKKIIIRSVPVKVGGEQTTGIRVKEVRV